MKLIISSLLVLGACVSIILGSVLPKSHAFVSNPDRRLERSLDEEAYYEDLSFEILTSRAIAASPGQGGSTCTPDSPCGNGACCGISGWCGYDPEHCGAGCQSNCNATAECGQYAEPSGKGCPLNVCCSQWGFCGTTEDFCDSGCQSNCPQPNPSAAASNVQKRIIGYWESWNDQHACGAMGVGQIPVNMLTHLNVAFGYINENFQVTNMDGVSSDVYRNVGNVKARNPSIKVNIALGGWSFSDPGPWRNVFPTLVSSQANRATFIQNLLGFLSEYGYDGVDFDWEYPGADDRGGTADDGVNYTALLKELRAAIQASGRDYTVTFTAPTSYWYLRHFDLANMVQYVDWVNLMAYDLHGVWDSSDPIGNQVLAHTNLTEIDLALDLFWRVGVEPSDIVLGLGFYGRSFQLESGSCWKPGCAFSGPGTAGPCTATPGILSYREITDILTATGATPYLDTEAAVRFMVYDSSSWISFDDATTFALKINYADQMGLGGLMVWAIDLDDNYLDALRAISDPSLLGSLDNPLTLVDLKYLFPTEDLPPADAVPKYGLVTFGGLGDSDPDPSDTAFGFLLIAGDSFAVTQLRKRSGEPDPFEFLDCPSDVLDQPKDKLQKARVICLSEDVKGCFRVTERGVQGTLVEMPDNCAPNTFARAVSLELAKDQYIPAEVLKRNPTSRVYDFHFDFDLQLMRRDTNNTSIRLDYSNVRGYWNTIVDSPGIQSRDVGPLANRFFAPTNDDWRAAYADAINFQYNPTDASTIKQDMSAPVFWQSVEECSLDGTDFGEGFGAYVQGSVDASFYYAFSMVAVLEGPDLATKQANGLFQVRGQTDLTYGIGGVGLVDISRANQGNPAFKAGPKISLPGNTISAGNERGWVTFDPYYQVTYQFATFNGTGDDPENGAAAFDGKLTTRTISDLGNFTAYWPSPETNTVDGLSSQRNLNQISIPSDNILYSTSGNGGSIAVGTYLTFGLSVDFFLFADLFHFDIGLPDMELLYNTMTVFNFYPGSSGSNSPTVCTDYDVITNVFQTANNSASVGWTDESGEAELAYDRQEPSGGKVCYSTVNPSKAKRAKLPDEFDMVTLDNINGSWFAGTQSSRSAEVPDADGSELAGRSNLGSMPAWGYLPNVGVDPNTYFGDNLGNGVFQDNDLKFNCRNCIDCDGEDQDIPYGCCGCVSMDYVWGYSDIPPCLLCNQDDGTWPGVIALKKKSVDPDHSNNTDDDTLETFDEYHPLERRVSGRATLSYKDVTVCGTSYHGTGNYRYPAFPANAGYPWDGIEGGRWDVISRYWGNSSYACENWGISNLQPADTEKIPPNGASVRAKYQTEHVFEGQLIGDFFSWWLDKGMVNNQNPPPTNPTPKVPCAFTNQYITGIVPNNPWLLDGQPQAFIYLMLAELGSIAHLDRLTVMQARPNRMKGSMFTGNQPTSITVYSNMNNDDQLQAVKEMGLIFTYLNTQAVWNSFCGSYEAIYTLLGQFDTWYSSQSGNPLAIPRLQDEWKSYVRVALDSMVMRSRATFDAMYANKRAFFLFSPPYSGQWIINRFINRQLIRLSLTCNNMNPSTV